MIMDAASMAGVPLMDTLPPEVLSVQFLTAVRTLVHVKETGKTPRKPETNSETGKKPVPPAAARTPRSIGRNAEKNAGRNVVLKTATTAAVSGIPRIPVPGGNVPTWFWPCPTCLHSNGLSPMT